ncbi:Endopolyphosphatase [Phlyctochytrium planicorne]|nr:Endopolyphosphatase [Phlyctochytrium planicorne]
MHRMLLVAVTISLVVGTGHAAALPPCTVKRVVDPTPSPGPVVGSGSGTFLHVTDIHLDPAYKEGTAVKNLCHRKDEVDASLNVAGKFGAIATDCDSPIALLDATFEFMKGNPNTNNPDFIIMTGDAARHDRDKVQARTDEDTLSDHRAVIKYFADTWDLGKIPLFPTIGNNDVFDHNSVAANTISPLLTNLLKIWEPLNLGLDKIDTFINAGYYSKQIFPNKNLHIISLNTMWLYKRNVKTTDCTTPDNPGTVMLDWFEAKLGEIRNGKGKAYVMGHIPPKDEFNARMYFDACYERYNGIVGRNLDVISAHFHGHVNQDMLTFMTDAKGKFELTVVNATVRPLEFDPRMDGNGIVHVFTTAPSIIPVFNPSVRVYGYGRDGAELLDYTQYYSDLVRDNSEGKVNWDVEYRAGDVYGVMDLSTQSLAKLIRGLYEDGSSTWPLYQKFFSASYTPTKV